VDLLGRLGCLMPSLANASLDSPMIRRLMRNAFGLTNKRPLPHYTKHRFDRWFSKHEATLRAKSVAALYERRNGETTVTDRRYRESNRGEIILWDDTFVRYHEPHIGIAAVKVLEALGFKVSLVKGRKCCGRPAFSQGNLEVAAGMGRHNLDLLRASNADTSIVFLEPSCYSLFVEDYRELKLPDTDSIAKRCHLFEQYVEEKLAARLPGRTATLLDTGCCGMAGAFGALESKYDLSLKVAAPLVQQVSAQPADSVIVASGTSCRHQLEHLTPVHPKHMAELLADAIAQNGAEPNGDGHGDR